MRFYMFTLLNKVEEMSSSNANAWAPNAPKVALPEGSDCLIKI